jgi:hypothetical protein
MCNINTVEVKVQKPGEARKNGGLKEMQEEINADYPLKIYVPWTQKLVTSLSPQRHKFNPGSANMVFNLCMLIIIHLLNSLLVMYQSVHHYSRNLPLRCKSMM